MNVEIPLDVKANTVKDKVSFKSFTTLKLIGKGSYAKVLLVRKIDDNKVYAMKILKKKRIKKPK